MAGPIANVKSVPITGPIDDRDLVVVQLHRQVRECISQDLVLEHEGRALLFKFSPVMISSKPIKSNCIFITR